MRRLWASLELDCSAGMQQIMCRRIGMEEERVSLWADLADSDLSHWCNNASVHLAAWIQLFTSIK